MHLQILSLELFSNMMVEIYTYKKHITAFYVSCVRMNACKFLLSQYIISVNDDTSVKFTSAASGKLSLSLKCIMACFPKQQANSFTWDQEHIAEL